MKSFGYWIAKVAIYPMEYWVIAGSISAASAYQTNRSPSVWFCGLEIIRNVVSVVDVESVS
jgi:hypothetical protein